MAKARILVVDDNLVNLKLATAVLDANGFAVVEAQDAIEAQARLAEQLPDLILMDIALPGMDGLTLTRHIKADPRTQRIPVIALTAFAMQRDHQRVLEAGCDGYITKPIDTRALPRVIEDTLRKASASSSERRDNGGALPH
jgi:CheY-like chemotaxis protein